MRTNQERGFSLVELIVAMAVTLIVTGAIYGLLSGGQSAFRREPELSDRQQNIRLAMDMIMRDVGSAGASMPPWIQTFTTGLDGGTITTCRNNANAVVTCPDAPSGAKVDEIEIMANPGGYDVEQACNAGTAGGTDMYVRLAGGTTRITAPFVPMIILNDGRWTFRNFNGGTAALVGTTGICLTGGTHAMLRFTAGGTDPTNYNLATGVCGGVFANGYCGAAPGNTCTAPGPASCDPVAVLPAEIVRYRIRPGTDNVPNLERFSSSLPTNFIAGVPQYQVIARGIDDLQLQYTNASNATTDNAPTIVQPATVPDWTGANSLITRVLVTLSARSEARNVAGARTVTSGPAALRGSLTSSGTPRAALGTLGGASAPRSSGSPPPWF